jgi:hypothetical protein
MDVKEVRGVDEDRRRGRLAMLALLMLWTGCGLFPQQNQMAGRRQTAVQHASDAEKAALVIPVCSKESSGGTGALVKDGITHRCGSVWVEISTDKARGEFLSTVCGGVDDESCGKIYSKMFLARLTERYTFADWTVVVRKCDAYPVECRDWGKVERWTLDTHNDEVLKRAQRAAEATHQRYVEARQRAIAEQQESNRKAMLILSGALDGLSAPYKNTVNCTSNTYGSTTQTTCR